MADLWIYFKNLFNKAEASSPSQPLVHEMIERSPEEKKDYDQWKDQLVRRRLQDWLMDQYAIFLQDPEGIDEAVDFLDTPSSKGFVIHFYKTNYSQRDVTYFFDYLKERVLAQNYRTQISDRRTYNRPKWVETVERHYLKPRTGFHQEDGQFRQFYGNVMVELQFRNEQVFNLKFRATIYKDAQFKEAWTFQDLMQAIR